MVMEELLSTNGTGGSHLHDVILNNDRPKGRHANNIIAADRLIKWPRVK
jgi:hypothetical protein